MPSGSGPQANAAAGVMLAADTVEHVLCTLPAGSWNQPLGNLLTWSAVFTGAAAGTLTFRVRQGTLITGVQVGPSVPLVVANGVVYTPGAVFADASAFGLAQQAGQYVLTYQQSAVSLGTANSAVLELETAAPVI